jgi:putative endonuclease
MPLRGYLYLLLCSDGSYYVGHTSNLELRMWEHQHGEGGSYTSQRLPVRLVFSEELPTVHDAFLAERQVKGWSRAKKNALIQRDFEALKELSKNRQTIELQRASFDKLRMP